MIVIHVMGGLGNQLYQYAMYEKLRSIGKNVKLDTYAYSENAGDDKEWRKLELDRFPHVQYERCTEEDRTVLLDNSMSAFSRIRRKLTGRKDKTVKETQDYMPQIFSMDNVYLYGFWNCEKYYENMQPLLRQKLQFPQSRDKTVNEKNKKCIEQMAQENSVSLHIRRSDYLTVADGKRYMGICTDDYYAKAIEYIKQRVENPVFYIFSDDAEYVRSHYKGANMRVVDWNSGDNSLFDMQLMSCCKHNICANSTFSIWGARLNPHNDKIMIRPLHHDNYEKTEPEQIKEYWKNWVLLDAEGKLV